MAVSNIGVVGSNRGLLQSLQRHPHGADVISHYCGGLKISQRSGALVLGWVSILACHPFPGPKHWRALGVGLVCVKRSESHHASNAGSFTNRARARFPASAALGLVREAVLTSRAMRSMNLMTKSGSGSG